MIKLIAFDVDNTLAHINKPVERETIEILKYIEKLGVRIVLISGKPAIYLSGMARQMGLNNPIIVGENGASILYDSSIPPSKTISIELIETKRNLLEKLQKRIEETFKDRIWFQPNLVNVTCFHKSEETKAQLIKFTEVLFEDEFYKENLEIYQHIDSIDIVPRGINKGKALLAIIAEENITNDEVIAVGDNENDFSMFDIAGLSLGINMYKPYKVSKEFESIITAMKFIKDRVENH